MRSLIQSLMTVFGEQISDVESKGYAGGIESPVDDL